MQSADNQEVSIEYHFELISNRRSPGDRWENVNQPGVVHPTLTDALEAWFQKTGEQADFKLSPLSSKLYVIRTEEVAPVVEPERTFSIYGEYSQNINQ